MVDRSGLRSIMRQGGRSPTRGRGRFKYCDPTKHRRDRRQALADVEAVRNMHPLDQAALYTSIIPIVGDIAGAAADIRRYTNDPSGTNLAFLLSNAIPFLPSGTVSGLIKSIKPRQGGLRYKPSEVKKVLKTTGQKAFTNLQNYIPGFYKPGIGKKTQGLTYLKTVPEGIGNILKARYDPQARGLQSNLNISAADRKAAQTALEVSNEITPQLKPLEKQMRAMRKDGSAYTGEIKTIKSGKNKGKKKNIETEKFIKLKEAAQELRRKANDAGKRAMGQFNQTRSMTKQYFGPNSGLEGIHKNINKIDHVKNFKTFNVNDYFKTVGDVIPSGIGKEGVQEIFKSIKKLPAIGYDASKNHQMNIRRVHTGSAGELDPGLSTKLYSLNSISLSDIKKSVFSSGKKYTNKGFLEALQKTGLTVLNPKQVLKGKPAVITGTMKTDAYEIGGANYMTSINKKGEVTTIMNDKHDLFGKVFPGGERYMNVSEPIVVDLAKTKQTTVKQAKAKDKLKKEKHEASKKAIENYKRIAPDIDISGPLPAGFKTKEQWARAQAVALAKSPDDYTRLMKEVGFVPTRIAKTSQSEQENKRGGGSVMERNPYDYQPRGI